MLKQIAITVATVLALYAVHYFLSSDTVTLEQFRQAQQRFEKQEARYSRLKDSIELMNELALLYAEQASYEVDLRFDDIETKFKNINRRYSQMQSSVLNIKTEYDSLRKDLSSYTVDALINFLDSE